MSDIDTTGEAAEKPPQADPAAVVASLERRLAELVTLVRKLDKDVSIRGDLRTWFLAREQLQDFTTMQKLDAFTGELRAAERRAADIGKAAAQGIEDFGRSLAELADNVRADQERRTLEHQDLVRAREDDRKAGAARLTQIEEGWNARWSESFEAVRGALATLRESDEKQAAAHEAADAAGRQKLEILTRRVGDLGGRLTKTGETHGKKLDELEQAVAIGFGALDERTGRVTRLARLGVAIGGSGAALAALALTVAILR